MSVPVIDTTTSVLGYKQWEAWNYQPYATNSPTSWSCANIPSGLSINSATGKISGAATERGIYVCFLTATNATGASAPLVLTIGISKAETAAIVPGGADTGIDLNIDVVTRDVSLAYNLAPIAGSPLFLLKESDTVILNIRFKKATVSLDPNPFSIKISFKELETEAVLFSAGGLISDTWARSAAVGEAAFFCVPVAITGASLATALANYEDDGGTKFDALCEIEWRQTISPIGGVSELVSTSRTFKVTLERDMEN